MRGVRVKRRGRTMVWAGAVALAAAVTAVAGYLGLMTYIQPWDDEGYALVTIAEYLHRGGLYDQVYTQYGPFYAEFWGALIGGFGIPLGNGPARWIALPVWLVTAALAGLSIWRLTGRALLGLATYLLTFATLGTLVQEPMHPGGLICLLLAALLAVTAFALPARPRLAAGLLGGLIAALALVKVNVGGLALIAALLAAALTLPGLRERRDVRTFACGLAVVAPLVLMARDLEEAWVQHYALVVVLATVAVVVTAWPREREDASAADPTARRYALPFVASLCAVVAVVALIAFATGTTPRGLFEGTLVNPLGQAAAFSLPATVSGRRVVVAVIGLVAALVVRRDPRLRATPGPVSLAAGAIILWSLADPAIFGLFGAGKPAFATAAPFAWAAVMPGPRSELDSTRRFAVLFVTALAVLQTLHAYPVAGSQVGFATFLLAAVGALCVARAWPIGFGRPLLTLVAPLFATALIVKVLVVGILDPLKETRAFYRANVTFDLPGTGDIRVPRPSRDEYRRVVTAIERHCSTFLTLPGMNGLYLLTARRPPTGYNTTAWMYLFDSRMQRKVVDALAPVKRLCLVRNDSVLHFWTRGRSIPRRPLYRFATTGWHPIGTYGGFVLETRVRG